MCQFNFLVIEKYKLESNLFDVANKAGFEFKNIKAIFTKDNISTLITGLSGENNCNCGSVFGNISWKEDSVFDTGGERKRLERKRFSSKRIDELISKKQREFETRNLDNQISEKNESDKWITFLTNLHLNKVIDKIGLMFHNYRGSIETEVVRVNETNCSWKNVDHDFLVNMKEDNIYWVVL